MFVLKEKGYSLRSIAKALGRSVSTVSDELKRNTVAGTYTPAKAHHKAYARRHDSKYQGMKIVVQPALQAFIEQALRNGQSPQAIAGRLATGIDALPFASRPTIERFIRSAYGRKLEYELKILKRKQNRKNRRKHPPTAALGKRTFIDKRPAAITNRERVGDLEADFIVSGKTGSGYLLTAADRKIRVGFIRKILPVSIANMEQAFVSVKAAFPELASITTDNDLLYRYHERLQTLLGMPIYFCHPYASWEKGTIENYNKQVRKYIPKGADISLYDATYLRFVEARLNSRFMSVLHYRMPQECLDEYRSEANKKSR